MKEMTVMPGDRIDLACERLLKEAPAFMVFNGTRLEARLGDTVQAIYNRWNATRPEPVDQLAKLRADLTKAEASIVEHKAELAALRNDRDRAQTAVGEHKATAFRFAAENERLRAACESMRIWIGLRGRGLPDWACEQCSPTSDLRVDGFVCGYHVALSMPSPSEGDPRG